MASERRVNLRAILADPDLRRKLMVPTIQATQAREGIETTTEQAERAYYVVTEAERATFFALARHRGGKGEPDRREEMFVRNVGNAAGSGRVDVARRDFAAIEGAPLAFQRIRLIAHIFREALALEPAFGRARQGAGTGDDSRYVRQWWELPSERGSGPLVWVPFAKGGDFCRFYFDIGLRVHWDLNRGTFAEFYGRKGREQERPVAAGEFFRSGLTWPLRTQRGFNLRVMPEGCVFGHKGPAILLNDVSKTFFILGIANSAPAEFLLRALMSFGSWEVGVIKRLPIPQTSATQVEKVSHLAQAIHDSKRDWDSGNETSTAFSQPWVLRVSNTAESLSAALDAILSAEAANEIRVRERYAELNDEAYGLYGIPDATRALIEESLGERPAEILWPQMEGKSVDQKRMEHVWRLLSYAVKRVIEADDDGIVPFTASSGETPLVERVRHELATLFAGRDESQLEVEIANELKRSVKGYRRCQSLDEWLENCFFDYHASLYKNRPIFWHIASAQGTAPFAFGALVHYHRFDKNRMAKLRASYVRDAIEDFRREAGLADKAGRAEDRLELQAKLEEVQALDKKLQHIQEGHHEGPEGGDRDFRILTPWKDANARPRGWAPDIDDGVKVNIAPLDRAGVLRIAGVAG